MVARWKRSAAGIRHRRPAQRVAQSWKRCRCMFTSGSVLFVIQSMIGMSMRHQHFEPIYRGSHGKSRLGTACKTRIRYGNRATLDEPGSQLALAVGSSH